MTSTSENDVSLACRCGTVRGVARGIAPTNVTHIVCYCDDCRAFLRHLERDDLIDAHGGTEIIQMTPAQVRITAGAEQLRCVRLSPKGMIRFYTACCRTPAGNTVSAGLPFVGMPRAILDAGLAASGKPVVALLGETIGLQGKFALNGPVRGAHPGMPPALLRRLVPILVKGFVRRRQQPSPYFDPATKAPRVTASVLTKAEREALRARDR